MKKRIKNIFNPLCCPDVHSSFPRLWENIGKSNFLLIILLLSNLEAESYWVKYGWQSFKNAADAQSLAIGQTQAAFYSGPISVLQNPAHAQYDLNQFLYAHQSRFAGLVNSDLIALPSLKRLRPPVKMILFHEGIYQIPDTRDVLLDWGSDGIPGTGDAGENNNQLDQGERLDATQVRFFHQSQWGIHLSSSWHLRAWTIGLGIKGLFHSFAEHYATGVGIDIGATTSLWTGNTVGLVFTDATTSWLVWENGSIERFRPQFISGIAQRFHLKKIPLSVMVMTDIVVDPFGQNINGDFNIGSFGGRYRSGLAVVYKRLSVRLGRGLNAIGSAGLGLDWEEFAIHYAYANTYQATWLGNSHLISFNLDMSWLAKQIEKII